MMGTTDTARPTAITIAIAIVVVLVLSGISVSGITKPHIPKAPIPKAITGYVYWPNGTLDTTVPIQISIKNNQTGATITTTVDVLPGGLPDGNYQTNVEVNLGNTVYVSCLYNNMWARNQTVYTGQTFLMCNLRMVSFPFGPQYITTSTGGSITGYGGAVTLDVPAGALAANTFIYGVDPLASKGGSLDSITLGPSGLAFSSPATLRWSYEGLNLGQVKPETLAIYTSNGGPWQKLPGFIDTQAREVTAQVIHFSNFSIGSAAAFGNQTGLVNVYAGTQNAPILDLTIINSDMVTDDTLNYINVLSNSTDGADISGIEIWNDLDNDQSVGAGDVQIGGTLLPGNANFTGLGINIPADSVLNLLAVVDVAAAATVGNHLDLSIPAQGIGLANAGLVEDAIDPAGNTTIAAELTDPHVVYGFVSNIFGPLPNVWVNLTNNRTLATEDLTTDSLGRYEINLGFMPGGYADWDEVFVQANDTFGQTGWNVTYVDVFMFGERCDIYIGKGPVAGNETPANGSIITDVYRNITVNITEGAGGIDITTIVLEVEGVNYTWGDANLGFSGDTLTFNTSGAVGAWTDGQVVNVTMWQANDTVGNMCQNAPYMWSFNVYLGPGPIADNETPALGSIVTDIYRNITVNITGGTGGIVLSTIILEVEGVNYTWGDANLGFSGDTLTFNTSGAVGAWTDGLVVNITLWQANDTVGNTCQNAPYVWWFMVSAGIAEPPANLTLSNDAGSVKLKWNVSANATSYTIFRSADRFTAWPWTSIASGIAATEWTDAPGTYNDAVTYYYIVRAGNAGGDSGNSSMGAKTLRTFTYLNPVLRTNAHWISLPYNSPFKKLSDIVVSIEGGTTGADRDRIVGVYYWNATQQQRIGITWSAFGWNLANNVNIRPGDGICLVLSNLLTVGQQFNWTITGTDVNSTQRFTYLNPVLRTNANWISVPFTSTYTKLSDIVVSIEGGTTGADRDRIVGVYYWNATQQQRIGITWSAFGWNLANNVNIRPGDGICIVLSNLLTVGQQFTWDPSLIIPPVPDMHYYD